MATKRKKAVHENCLMIFLKPHTELSDCPKKFLTLPHFPKIGEGVQIRESDLLGEGAVTKWVVQNVDHQINFGDDESENHMTTVLELIPRA